MTLRRSEGPPPATTSPVDMITQVRVLDPYFHDLRKGSLHLVFERRRP
jgi:hypothetical protein